MHSAKYKMQNNSTSRATLFLCKFWPFAPMYRVFTSRDQLVAQGKLSFDEPRDTSLPAWQAVDREESQNERGEEKRPIFSRLTRSSFLFPSPSDACHAGWRETGASLILVWRRANEPRSRSFRPMSSPRVSSSPGLRVDSPVVCSRFARGLKVSLFLLDLRIKRIKSSSRSFLTDHIDPETTKLSNKALWSIICRSIDIKPEKTKLSNKARSIDETLSV